MRDMFKACQKGKTVAELVSSRRFCSATDIHKYEHMVPLQVYMTREGGRS